MSKRWRNKVKRLLLLATVIALLVGVMPAFACGDGEECSPPPPQGCTPGYWKNHDWDLYCPCNWPATPDTLVVNIFDFPADSPLLTNGMLDLNGDGNPDTLQDALNYNGGGGIKGAARIMLRAAVAAFLNGISFPGYPYTCHEVRNMVAHEITATRASMLVTAEDFDYYNNLGCPLN